MKKLLLSLFLVLLSVSAFALPGDLALNCTFSNFKVSSDGVNWETIISAPFTVNLLAITNESGTSITMTPPPAGTYRYLGMGVTAIYFSQPGQPDRDILALLKAQSGSGVNWGNMTTQILPFTYSGSGKLNFNMFFPPSNISGTTYDTYFPVDGPVFGFSGGTVSTDVGTYNVSIASGVDTGAKIYLGAFQSFTQQAAPMFTGTLTNAGNGSASGTLKVPPGSFYLMAVAMSGTMGAEGPPEGAKAYSVGGALPWSGSISPSAVATGETTAVSLQYAFTITSTMGAGGGGQKPTGSAIVTFEVDPAVALTLSASSELMVYAFQSVADYQAGGAPAYFLGSKKVAKGSFSGTSLTCSGLGAGTYVAVALLNISGSTPPVAGTDYIGVYGGLQTPSLITVTADSALNLTSSPISLVVVPSQ